MPRYFFHLDGPDGRIEDHEGVVARSPEEALRECLDVIGELREGAASAEEWRGWSLVLVCEEVPLALTLSLHDTIVLHEVGPDASRMVHRNVQ